MEEKKAVAKKALAIAKELKKEGLTIDFIAKITKLRVDEIQALGNNTSQV